jgi:hypothetical protein
MRSLVNQCRDGLKTSITTPQPRRYAGHVDRPVETYVASYRRRLYAQGASSIKSDRCSAEGLEVRANAPGLAMCRKLLESGYDPDRPLHCFWGETLAMKISSIAYGARYSVSEPSTGSGVRPVPFSEGPKKSGVASPIRFSDAAE